MNSDDDKHERSSDTSNDDDSSEHEHDSSNDDSNDDSTSSNDSDEHDTARAGDDPSARAGTRDRWESTFPGDDLERADLDPAAPALVGLDVATGPPPPPRGSRAGGRRLWHSVVDGFDLDEHELALLTEACRTVDQLDALDTRVRRDGVIVTTSQGERAHPALVESRQLRIVLARLLAGLRLPSGEAGDEQSTARPQRRSGYRGVYGITGVAR